MQHKHALCVPMQPILYKFHSVKMKDMHRIFSYSNNDIGILMLIWTGIEWFRFESRVYYYPKIKHTHIEIHLYSQYISANIQ